VTKQKGGAFISFSSQASIFKKIDHHNQYNEMNEYQNEDMRVRKARLMKEANWNDLLFWDKLRLFEIWSIISIIANLC
jgi:hypothetical protein